MRKMRGIRALLFGGVEPSPGRRYNVRDGVARAPHDATRRRDVRLAAPKRRARRPLLRIHHGRRRVPRAGANQARDRARRDRTFRDDAGAPPPAPRRAVRARHVDRGQGGRRGGVPIRRRAARRLVFRARGKPPRVPRHSRPTLRGRRRGSSPDATRRGAQQSFRRAPPRGSPRGRPRRRRRVRLRAIRLAQGAFPPRRVSSPSVAATTPSTRTRRRPDSTPRAETTPTLPPPDPVLAARVCAVRAAIDAVRDLEDEETALRESTAAAAAAADAADPATADARVSDLIRSADDRERPLAAKVAIRRVESLLRESNPREHRLHELVSALHAVLAAEPENPDASFRLAGAYRRLGRVQDAADAARRCADVAPGFAPRGSRRVNSSNTSVETETPRPRTSPPYPGSTTIPTRGRAWRVSGRVKGASRTPSPRSERRRGAARRGTRRAPEKIRPSRSRSRISSH